MRDKEEIKARIEALEKEKKPGDPYRNLRRTWETRIRELKWVLDETR